MQSCYGNRWNIRGTWCPMRPTRWFDLSLRLRPATPSSGDERWWRFVHMIGDNEICVEHALGQVCATFPILGVHERAGEVLADWENSRRPVTAWLASANDGELLEPRQTTSAAELRARF